jgi:phage-related protein
MADIFTPPRPPATSSGGMSAKPRTLSNHYGGDMTRDIADGINVNMLSYEGTWDLDWAESTVVMTFLRAHLGKSFLWIAPRDKVYRYWQATSWTRSTVAPHHDKITISMEVRNL